MKILLTILMIPFALILYFSLQIIEIAKMISDVIIYKFKQKSKQWYKMSNNLINHIYRKLKGE